MNIIYIPEYITKKKLRWNHHYIYHPRKTRMRTFFASTLYLLEIQEEEEEIWKTTTQEHKMALNDQKVYERIINTIIFLEPATGWFKKAEISEKTSTRISHIFNCT